MIEYSYILAILLKLYLKFWEIKVRVSKKKKKKKSLEYKW